jgi:uncharacterized delta-60 repeat protein
MHILLRRYTRARFVALAALLAVAGLAWPGAQPGRAWPGGVDGTFAEGGGTFVDGGGHDFAIEIATLPNGGTASLIDVGSAVGILKLGPDGARDQAFGDDGLMVDPLPQGSPVDFQPVAAGKFVVLTQAAGTFSFHRYGADGTPDPTFGGDGVVDVPSGQESFGVGGLAVQPDSKLVVAGTSPNGYPAQKVIWRFNADGSPDPTFGTGGRTNFPIGDGPDQVTSVLVQSDGRIAAGGTGYPNGSVFRVTASGAIDQSFGTQGIATTTAIVRDLIQAPDGTLLYTGRVGEDFATHVYRLSASGAPSATSTELPGEAMGLALAPGGRVLAVGSVLLDLQGPTVLFVARLTNTLNSDPTFGVDGVVGYGFRSTSASAATVQPDGRIIVAANDRDNSNINDSDAVIVGMRGGFPLGFMLDGWGGLHPLSSGRAVPATTTNNAPYWKGWDIARGVALKGDQTGGYELDGWGGIHSFGVNGHAPPARVNGGPYWRDWDIARDIAILPDETGGYVLDGWGGLHPFGLNGNPPPPYITTGPYWTGWDIARGLAILPDGTGGYVLDGWGGIHPFAIGDFPPPDYFETGPYWRNWDIARDIELYPFGGAYVLDGWGGLHGVAPFEGFPTPPSLSGQPYWSGWDIARSLSMP